MKHRMSVKERRGYLVDLYSYQQGVQICYLVHSEKQYRGVSKCNSNAIVEQSQNIDRMDSF
jgi:hypothetical protein